MRSIRYCGALLFLVVVVVAGGPLGCELLGALGGAEIPKLEDPKAPDVKAPDAPKGPDVDDDDGSCCIRGTAPVEEVCGAGVSRCCSQKYDRDECEAVNGSWFTTGSGCRGAC